MSFKLRRETALDLALEGSTGSFRVGTGKPGQNSIEVKYFLTHIGLDFASNVNESVLKHIAPVREIFEFEHLEFDEIMQRDIDDARVSAELIPYLLDAKSADLIKLFPPIIVVVLPIREGENRPADLYPLVKEFDEPGDELGVEYIKVLRAGSVGQEVFQFEEPFFEGRLLKHDLNRFRLNTNRTKLVIVDGQHRAMALLALYRNIKEQWSDERRAPYKEYYAEWTPAYLKQFNLSEINLPVMLCTFPQLDESYQGDFDLKKAARAIFLTLNKTARKVSDSRNILLDDNDLIADFLRRTLSVVKKKDLHSPFSLRIHNVELDQFEDRTKLTDPIAVTGVNHVHYIIEHLMLNEGEADVNGAKPRKGRFSTRKDLSRYRLMDRLNGWNLLGAEEAEAASRDFFTRAVAETLGKSFLDRYSKYIVTAFEEFLPYEYHNYAVLEQRKVLEVNEDRKLIPILFEGQGIGKVFNRHRDTLKEKLREGLFGSQTPEIMAILERLNGTALRIDRAVESLRLRRNDRYLSNIKDKSSIKIDSVEWHPGALAWLDNLYDNVFTTVAFQSAMICGFFGEIERAKPSLLDGEGDISVDQEFRTYLSQIGEFFVPRTFSHLKRLIRIFDGELVTDEGVWKIRPSNQTFRSVVYRGEMQPDQWPKYKYLIIEIWEPENNALRDSVYETRDKCRKQVFASLYKSIKDSYLKEHTKLEDDLEEREYMEIFTAGYEAYSGFLVNLDAEAPPVDELKRMLAEDFETANTEDTLVESD